MRRIKDAMAPNIDCRWALQSGHFAPGYSELPFVDLCLFNFHAVREVDSAANPKTLPQSRD
jgi:hypothetical protein